MWGLKEVEGNRKSLKEEIEFEIGFEGWLEFWKVEWDDREMEKMSGGKYFCERKNMSIGMR